MADGIELTKALVPLAWPALAAFLLWKLFPFITTIAASRAFVVKVAGMEISVQEATQQLRTQIEDLQRQVIQLRDETGGREPGPSTERVAPPPPTRPVVLWVDDVPSNNVFEIAQLQERGIEVLTARSTDEALEIIARRPEVGAVISDMARTEGQLHQAQAGLALLSQLRERGVTLPFIIYSSPRTADRDRALVRERGGDDATASPIELIEWLGRTLPAR